VSAQARVVPPCLFLERGVRYYYEAWDALASETGGDKVEENPASGEVWQYMGSWKLYPDAPCPARWVHQFRHRDHPRTGSRLVRNLPVSEGFRLWADRELLARR